MKRVFTPIFIDKAVMSKLRMISLNGQNGRIHTFTYLLIVACSLTQCQF
jgi:hypothetical protein